MKQSLIILLIGFLLSAFSEDPIQISVKDVLASTLRERRFVNSQKNIDFANSLNYRLPVLSDLGFKYGADDFLKSKQQYAMTLGFNSFRKIREQAAIKNAQINLYLAKKDILTEQVIKERYKDIVDVYCTNLVINNQKRLDTLLNQRNIAFKTALQKGVSIKIKDLVETEEDMRNLSESLSETQNIYAVGYQRIRDYLGVQHNVALNFGNFISVTKLENVLNTLKMTRNWQTPEVKMYQNQISLAQAELKLEEADFKQVFDGVQFVYERSPKNDFSIKDFSYRVGVKIPLKGNFRPKQNELLLDIKEAENDYNFASYETERTIKMQILKVENTLKLYNETQGKLNSSLAKSFLSTPSVYNTLSATDIIDLKIIQQKKEIELSEVHYKLISEYIALLDMTGNLVYMPYKNYLSDDLEKW